MVAMKLQPHVESVEQLSIPISNTDFHYFALKADLDTVVTLLREGEEILFEGTCDVNDVSGVALAIIENAVNWAPLDTLTTSIARTDSRGFTGLRFKSPSGPAAIVKGTIVQYAAQQLETKG